MDEGWAALVVTALWAIAGAVLYGREKAPGTIRNVTESSSATGEAGDHSRAAVQSANR